MQRLVRAHGYAIPVIADGQVENSSQLLKAVCVGASAVVIDKMVQGTEEVPGEHLFREGIRVRQRTYPSSIPGGRGYHCSDLGGGPVHPLGTAETIITQGSVSQLIPAVFQDVQRGFQALGVTSVEAAHGALKENTLRLECQVSRSGLEAKEHPQIVRLAVAEMYNSW